ncbi:MAG: adenylate/guanylate cyclase domain-containing protein [Actinomycetota bacterium]
MGVYEGLQGLVRRLAYVGSRDDDPAEERLRRATLTLATGLTIVLAIPWVVGYGVAGLVVPASLAGAGQFGALVALVFLARTKRFEIFRIVELTAILLLPFALHWSLGGFVASSAIVLWSMQAPLGVVMFEGTKRALPWFLAFAALTAISGALDGVLASKAPFIPAGVIIGFFVVNIGGLSTVSFIALQFVVGERLRILHALDAERERAEHLLRHVLPEPIAERLKHEDGVIAELHGDATILFADLAGFTRLSKRVPPERLVEILDEVFSAFDRLVEVHGLEKIKTVGDAYMAAGGLLGPREDHPSAIAELALDMLDEVEQLAHLLGQELTLRIGIDTGPVVAGVIGKSRLAYDVWGDTVNTASHMQSRGVPGKAQVTERTYERLVEAYRFKRRRLLRVKGSGTMVAYLMIGRREEAVRASAVGQ